MLISYNQTLETQYFLWWNSAMVSLKISPCAHCSILILINFRSLMEKTLQTCKDMRPGGKWGYYLYPECYNYKGAKECSREAKFMVSQQSVSDMKNIHS